MSDNNENTTTDLEDKLKELVTTKKKFRQTEEKGLIILTIEVTEKESLVLTSNDLGRFLGLEAHTA